MPLNASQARPFCAPELDPPTARDIVERLLRANTTETDTQYRVLTAQQEGAIIDLLSTTRWAEDEMVGARAQRDQALAQAREAIETCQRFQEMLNQANEARAEAMALATRSVDALAAITGIGKGVG